MGMALKRPIENTEPVVQLLSIGHIRKGMGRKPVLATGFVRLPAERLKIHVCLYGHWSKTLW